MKHDPVIFVHLEVECLVVCGYCTRVSRAAEPEKAHIDSTQHVGQEEMVPAELQLRAVAKDLQGVFAVYHSFQNDM